VGGIVVLVGGLIGSLLGGQLQEPTARNFAVTQAQRAFRSETGLGLVRFRQASTTEVTSLRTKPYDTKRFGMFQLFVVRPDRVNRMRRVFTNGVDPDSRGVYWVPDRMGGWIAVTLFDRNLVLAWFPPYPSRDTDRRWIRLSSAVRRLAPQGHLQPGA
jgi:hypothetical protein